MTSKHQFDGKKVTVGELGRTQSGGTPSSKHPEYFEGSIPWIGTTALNGKLLNKSDAIKLITEEAITKSSTKLVPQYSIMVGIRVGVGKVAINAVPMCTSQDIVSIVGIDETLWNKEYISLVLQYKAPLLAAQAQGATITGITSKTLKSIAIPAIPLESQNEIVHRLGKIEWQMDSVREQLVKLDSLVKSRFIEMFGDPIDGTFWAKRKLSNLYEVKSSKRIYAREQTKDGVPFLRLADIGSLIDSGISDSGLFISEERFEELRSKGLVPNPGDVLVTARGTLGRCYIIKPSDCFYFQDGMITWLAAIESSPLPSYLLAVFNNPHFIEELNRNCSGTTVKYLSISDLANVAIPVPPLELQHEFETFVTQVDKSRFVAQQQIEKLQLLYDSLAQEYFGE